MAKRCVLLYTEIILHFCTRQATPEEHVFYCNASVTGHNSDSRIVEVTQVCLQA